MQTKYFKRLLPLTAVALLILAFLAIELTPGPCDRKDEWREPLATTQPKHHQEYREASQRARAILPKYEDMFWRQPNVWSTGIGFFVSEEDIPLEFPDGDGGCKNVVGFIIRVTEKVDQSALPPGDRIPDTIEGVPVQIVEVAEGFNFPAP